MQVGDGVPGHPPRWRLAKHAVPGDAHLGCATIVGHPAGRCSEPRAEDPLDRPVPSRIMGQDSAQSRPERQVGVD
jgi:hypothetical protein